MLKEVASAIDDVGDAAAGQFLRIPVQRRAGFHQDADVAQRDAARVRVARRRVGPPARIGSEIGDQARHRGRFLPAQFVEPGLMQGQLGVEQRHPRPTGGRAVGVNRLVLRLRPGELRVGREHRAEGGVDPVRDLRQRAEVLRDRRDARAALRLPLEHLPGAQVGIDVGAPEAVDRLLRIADDEQLARLQRYLVPGARPRAARPRAARRRRVIGGEQKHDFGLQRVGVLEFVHQQKSKPFAQRGAHLLIAGHQRPRLDQQVVEVELAGAPPRPRPRSSRTRRARR